MWNGPDKVIVGEQSLVRSENRPDSTKNKKTQANKKINSLLTVIYYMVKTMNA